MQPQCTSSRSGLGTTTSLAHRAHDVGRPQSWRLTHQSLNRLARAACTLCSKPSRHTPATPIPERRMQGKTIIGSATGTPSSGDVPAPALPHPVPALPCNSLSRLMSPPSHPSPFQLPCPPRTKGPLRPARGGGADGGGCGRATASILVHDGEKGLGEHAHSWRGAPRRRRTRPRSAAPRGGFAARSAAQGTRPRVVGGGGDVR